MTTVAAALRQRLDELSIDLPGAPDADFVVAPGSVEEAAEVFDGASEHGLRVLLWGGGTHQGFGYPIQPDIVLGTRRLTTITDYRPDDLTVVVEAGVQVATLERRLSEHGQTALLPELPGEASVGGVIAAGISGWQRLRYGPTRDRVLEVVFATGDGRVVRAGGQVVKNVSGYDLPRLATGSFGSLGMIGRVALKLWPLGAAAATVDVQDAERALGTAFRPLAVIEEDGAAWVFLAGTPAEVEAQTADLGGDAMPGLHWPHQVAGPVEVVVRVPAGLTRVAVERVPPGHHYQAAFGVGEVRIGGLGEDLAALAALRSWAESEGGALVVARAPHAFYDEFDPWGAPPPSLDLQRRVKQAFDPLGVCNPGRLPGRL